MQSLHTIREKLQDIFFNIWIDIDTKKHRNYQPVQNKKLSCAAFAVFSKDLSRSEKQISISAKKDFRRCFFL